MREFALLPLLALVTGEVPENPDVIAERLGADSPQTATLIADYPDMKREWADPMWADVLLRAPLIPGTPWRVHDLRRPQPPLSTPAMKECAEMKAPSDAVRLLDRDMMNFEGPGIALWDLRDGILTTSGTENNRLSSRAVLGNVQVHLEFRLPMPGGRGWQVRGNSGVFFMGMYEVQILDSHQNPTYPDGQMGALYGQVPPLANASLSPGRWQCLDMIFTAPRFSGGKLTAPARVTVMHNGVLIQNGSAFIGPTVFGSLADYSPHADALPIGLQDHGDATSKVSFRNIWARPLP